MPEEAEQKSGTTVLGNPDRTMKVTDHHLSEAAIAAREAAMHRHERPEKDEDSDDELRNHLLTGAALLNNIFTFAKDTILPDFAKKASDDDATVTHITEVKKLDNVELDTPAASRPLPDLDEYYEMQKRFAEGGQGFLCKARDKLLNRIVAMKSLRPELRSNEAITRAFLSEALITAQLEHPSIVTIYGLLQDKEHGIYLAMKLVKGRDMRTFINEQITGYTRTSSSQRLYDSRLPARIEMFLKICDAMAYAHARGVIHCDLKPENIMLGEYGEVYVMDWGLARHIRNAAGGSAPVAARDSENRLDGTPRFIPPETYSSGQRDERSDIYALGLILFELLTLRRAYDGGEVNEVIRQVKSNSRHPVEHKFGLKIPTPLRAITDKATAYNPDDRYQSVAEFSRDLQRYLADETVAAMPETWFLRSMRWFRRHLRSVILCSLISWLAAALVGGHAARETILSLQKQAHHAEVLLSATDGSHADLTTQIASYDSRTMAAALTLADRMHSYAAGLGAIAGRIGATLDLPATATAGTAAAGDLPIVEAEQLQDGQYGAVYSAPYGSAVSAGCITASLADGHAAGGTQQLFSTLAPTARLLRSLVLPAPAEDAESAAEQQSKLAEGVLPLCRVTLTLIREQLRLTYPGGAPATVWDTASLRAIAARRSADFIWQPPYRDENRPVWLTTGAAPILDADGLFCGLLSGEIDLEALLLTLPVPREREDPALLSRSLYTDSGQHLATVSRDQNGDFTPIRPAAPPPAPFLAGGRGTRNRRTAKPVLNGHRLSSGDGQSIIFHYAGIPQLGLYVVDKTAPARYNAP